jgi:hypothetical protein
MFKNRPSLMLTTNTGTRTIFSKNAYLHLVSKAERFQVDYIFEFQSKDAKSDIFTFNRFASWAEVRDGVLSYFCNDFLSGNGWHLALAVARRNQSRFLAFIDKDGAAVHVVADNTDGTVLDIRGILSLDQALSPFTSGRQKISVQPMDVAMVIAHLNLMADMSDETRENWNAPDTCEFASLSDQLLEIIKDI